MPQAAILAAGCPAGRARPQSASAVLGRVAATLGSDVSTICSRAKYFKKTDYDDVYLIALDRMIEAQENVVAIIPETFINSSYRQKSKLNSISVLEENPFQDTDTPVVVVCFVVNEKSFKKMLRNLLIFGY